MKWLQQPEYKTQMCFSILQGKIEFGVINQSVSAFNHILTDVSLVVYQVGARALMVVECCHKL